MIWVEMISSPFTWYLMSTYDSQQKHAVPQRQVSAHCVGRMTLRGGGTYVAAGLDIDLLDLARLDITAKRSVYPRQACMYVSFWHLQGQLRGL